MIKVIVERQDEFIASKEKTNGDFIFFSNESKTVKVLFLGLLIFKREYHYKVEKLPEFSNAKKTVGY